MMRTRTSRFFLVLLATVTLLLPSPKASADTIDDLAWLLDQLDSANANPFPISGADLKDSKQLIECLADNGGTDVGVAGCLAQHGKTQLGSKVAGLGGIPSWFWDFIDLYIAFRTDDFWGVVSNIGEAGFCIVAQVMAGGALDVCGLIGELVEVGKALLDMGKAFAEFFAALGEGALDIAEAIGCSLPFVDCSGPSTPPEQVAYSFVFYPKIGAGMQAREKVDASAFEKLRTQLEKDAATCPASFVGSPPTTCSSETAVQIASGVYDGVVDGQWSADVAQNVLPALAKKRGEYDAKLQVALVALDAAGAYLQKSTPPGGYVTTRCSADFSTGFGYAHVDRWIMMHPAKAAELGNLKSSLDWCKASFWEKNKPAFAEHFRGFAKAKLCTGASPTQSLVCNELDGYQKCLGLLDSVGQKALCTANIATVGWDAAKKIQKYFKDHGSTIPCQTPKPLPTSQSADFICKRPPQGASCEKAYAALFANSPQKLVSCKVNTNLDPNYKALMAKVPGAAAKLATPHKVQFAIDAIDPLLVAVGKDAIAILKAEPNQNQGFGPPSAKPGFDFFLSIPRPIDGVSTPAFATALKLDLPTQKEPLTLQEHVKGMGDPDPTQRVTPEGELTSRKAKAVPAKTGSLPGAWDAAKSPSAPARAAGAAAVLPDLTLAPTLRLGATSGSWGGSLSLPAVQARRQVRGLCEFELRYQERNIGSGAALASSRSLQSGRDVRAAPARSEAIPVGGRQEIVETVLLKPGVNELRLSLDEANQIAEAQEANNEFKLRVEVTGSCDSAEVPARVTPTSPEPRAPQQR